MRLHDLVETSQRVSRTRARLEKIGLLAGCLGRVEVDGLEAAIGFLTGRPRQGRIGIGPSVLRAALEAASPAHEPSLTLAEVDAELDALAGLAGSGSARARRERLGALLERGTRDEQEFLVRLLVGELRQGALEGLMVEATARAAELPAAAVRRALMLAGDLGRVARTARVEGRAGLERFGVELFRPLKPMLASPADDVAGALEALGEAGLEYKLDGARVQVHKSGDEVRVFSRRLHDVTRAVPEIVEAVRPLAAGAAILDGEVLALRPDGFPQPFQVTMRRFGRRLDVEALRGELPVRAFFFDCLRLDGDTLIDRPARERLAALDAALPADLVIPRTVTADPEAADAFLSQALERGHEGVMAKALDHGYAAGARGRAWLKIKRAHTLDLVVLAAEWGHGRRRGWLSNLHLGARDPMTGGFVMLGKTFKGMTDAMLEWQTKRLGELELGRDDYTVHVRPELVVEVAFNDLQASPHYPGGLALRFARVKRYRTDKRAADADTIDTVRALAEGGRC